MKRKPVLAQALSKWRQENGLTQAQAAAKLGLPHRTYEAYEQGRYGARPFTRALILKTITT